jgi:hypothetical protein
MGFIHRKQGWFNIETSTFTANSMKRIKGKRKL